MYIWQKQNFYFSANHNRVNKWLNMNMLSGWKSHTYFCSYFSCHFMVDDVIAWIIVPLSSTFSLFLFVSLLFNSKISKGHIIHTFIYILCTMLYSDLNFSGKCDESASVGTMDRQKCIHNNSGQAQQLLKWIEKWHAALTLPLSLTLALWLSVASCLHL